MGLPKKAAAAAAVIAAAVLAAASVSRVAAPELPPHELRSVRGVLVRVNPLAHGVVGAGCLDGSDPVYYHRAAPRGSANASRWLLYFQGGGWCAPGNGTHAPFPPSLVDRCNTRSQTKLGSTREDPEEKDFDEKPLFSRDPIQNHVFHDWHIVFIRYCDGASFASAAGLANFQALLRNLLADEGSVTAFREASAVVVSGCSAGAVAAALHADAVQLALPDAFVTALLDSGFFPDWSRGSLTSISVSGASDAAAESTGAPPGVWSLDAELRHVFETRGLGEAGAFPTACLKHHAEAPWRCLFLEYLLAFVKVPAFVLQSRVDSSNVHSVDDFSSLQLLARGVDWRLQEAIGTGSGLHGAFLDSCFHHCMSWGHIAASGGDTQPDAFATWWAGVAKGQSLAQRLRLWDHGGPGSPCLNESCCSSAQSDYGFWLSTFSSSAAAAANSECGAGNNEVDDNADSKV